MNRLIETLREIRPSRLAILGTGLILLIAVAVYGTMRVGQSDLALLYGSLEPSDASQIVSELNSMGVPFEQRAGGSEIYVPGSRVLEVRMAMATMGLPNGLPGNDILDRDGGFGETREMQGANLRRALEGELARTIRSMSEISSARVHLSLPKRELFTHDRKEASASVMVTVKGRATRLSSSQVGAIQHLVASAVTGLDPANISLIDNNGNQYIAGGGEDGTRALSQADDNRINFQSRMKEKIENLLAQSVGHGNVRAEVTAEINFDQSTINSVEVDPESKVEISVQAVEETSDRSELDVAENISAENNLPNQEGSETGTRTNDTTSRTQETVNYDFSKITKTLVGIGGEVKRLSVAVIVDGDYQVDAAGERTYQPRSPEFIEELTVLTKAAIGFNADRGDVVDVRNQRFFEIDEDSMYQEPFIDLGKGDFFKIAEIVVLLVVSIMVVMLVLKPLAARALDENGEGDGRQAALAGPDAEQARIEAEKAEQEEVSIDHEVDQIEGRLRAVELQKIDALVDKYPEHAVNIIRGWLFK